MQDIQLVLAHLVDDRLDVADRQEMAGGIEHQAAPAKARRVVDRHVVEHDRRAGLVIRRQQLRQRHGAVIETRFAARRNAYALAGDFQMIAFGIVAGLVRQGQFDMRLGAGRSRKIETAQGLDQRPQLPGGACGVAGRTDRRRAINGEMPLSRCHVGRPRDQFGLFNKRRVLSGRLPADRQGSQATECKTQAHHSPLGLP